jgi:hypothetical protein
MPPKPIRAEFYRREAARLRRLAEVATLAEVRVNLVRTSHLYEAMARRAMASTTAVAPSSHAEPERTALVAPEATSQDPDRS